MSATRTRARSTDARAAAALDRAGWSEPPPVFGSWRGALANDEQRKRVVETLAQHNVTIDQRSEAFQVPSPTEFTANVVGRSDVDLAAALRGLATVTTCTNLATGRQETRIHVPLVRVDTTKTQARARRMAWSAMFTGTVAIVHAVWTLLRLVM